MKIWKWPLEITDLQTLDIPSDATILTVQTQNGSPQLWALCATPVENTTPRHIAIYGTGNPLPDNVGRYISTFQMHDGAFVFHAFEVANGK